VRDVKLSYALNGCQSGSAILVQSGNGLSAVVAIEESSIHDYHSSFRLPPGGAVCVAAL
jgi:hypothetical protein